MFLSQGVPGAGLELEGDGPLSLWSTCNFFVFLGCPCKCPSEGCRGVPSAAQQSMIRSLWDRNCSNCRLAEDLSTGCGSKLLGVQSELAVFDTAVGSLRDLMHGAAKQRASSSANGFRAEVVPLVLRNLGALMLLHSFLNLFDQPFFIRSSWSLRYLPQCPELVAPRISVSCGVCVGVGMLWVGCC